MSDFEYIDHDETPCPKCGGDTRTRDCTAIDCEEGYYHDCGEDCCCCLQPKPNRACDECGGHGFMHWCPTCGWDLNFNHYINGKDEREMKGFRGIGTAKGIAECGE